MGSELLKSDSPPQPGGGSPKDPPPDIVKVLYDQFSEYLVMGMSYDEYWNQDSALVKCYRDAFDKKRHLENLSQWRMGLYVYHAIGNMSPILHAFAKEGTQAAPYLQEPFPLTEEDLEEKKLREEKEAYDQNKDYMMRFLKEVKQDG